MTAQTQRDVSAVRKVTVIDHPLLKRDLSVLRDVRTPHGTFRSTLSDAAAILAYEAMRGLPLAESEIQTPLESTVAYELREEVIVVPILRAGLGMVDGFTRFVPEARVGHLGMYRDETTHEPIDYYSNIPGGLDRALLFVVDPMLATGGSATGAVAHLKERGAGNFTFVCLVAAPEGIARLHDAHPDVHIITATIDRELDDNAYIRPGLGDAGDRIFGTQ